MITICVTHFKSLALTNLQAALFSVCQQDLSRVTSIVVLDNDSGATVEEIWATVDSLAFPVPVRVMSVKHDDPTKTHSWSTNLAVSYALTPWVLFTRADYILDFTLVQRCVETIESHRVGWNGFVTGHVYHLNDDVGICERTRWRREGPKALRYLPGAEADYTHIDAGVWLTRKTTFDAVGGLDEHLVAWGHAQTDFQHRLFKAGVEFVRVPEVMFYHPQHAAVRDIDVSHQQLRDRGIDLKELWARYEGVQPY